MRALIPLMVAALAATVATAVPHVVTEFSIPIPHTPAAPAVQALNGDIFAVLTDSGITAVNLSTKAVLWNYASAGGSGGVTDFYIATGGNVLVLGNTQTEGIDIKTGASLWKNTTVSVYSDADSIKFMNVGSNVVVMTDSDLFSVNVATGVFAYRVSLSSPPMAAGNNLYYSSTNGKLVALNLETGVETWSISAPGTGNTFNDVLYADSTYVVTSITTMAGDTALFVAEAANGHQKLRLDGMEGINEDDGPVTISGSNLTVVAGNNPRTYTIDLNTGYILSQKPYSGGGGGGGGGGGQGEYSLTLANGDVLKIHSTASHTTPAMYGEGFSIQKSSAGGDFTTVCPHTPSNSAFNMAYLGDGLLKVGNLQGWVLYDIQGTTCTTLTRNEKLPGYTTQKGGVIYKYKGDFVDVEGKDVIGYKIVR